MRFLGIPAPNFADDVKGDADADTPVNGNTPIVKLWDAGIKRSARGDRLFDAVAWE
jgi:hypothetical protein